MNIFLDTSSLVKIYHRETGTDELMMLFKEGRVEKMFLSSLTRVELHAALWKRYRMKHISIEMREIFAANFERDTVKYSWIEDNDEIKQNAITLLNKYGSDVSLKSFDSLQLATAASLRNEADLFITADKVLQKLFLAERLPIN